MIHYFLSDDIVVSSALMMIYFIVRASGIMHPPEMIRSTIQVLMADRQIQGWADAIIPLIDKIA